MVAERFFGQLVAACLLAIGFGLITNAQGAVIVGGSDLVTASDADQLQTWLGSGPITITRIFQHVTGDQTTSVEFHAAVDGQGATFSVIRVVGGVYGDSTQQGGIRISDQIIGGYNPQSWSSIGDFNYTIAEIDRTAFIFNLTTDEIQRQRLDFKGEYQTANFENLGPIFGGGLDIFVDNNLDGGSSTHFSYGEDVPFGSSIIDGLGFSVSGRSFMGLVYSEVEVFSISPASAAVPEPASMAIWSLGALGCAITGYRRRKAV